MFLLVGIDYEHGGGKSFFVFYHYLKSPWGWKVIFVVVIFICLFLADIFCLFFTTTSSNVAEISFFVVIFLVCCSG